MFESFNRALAEDLDRSPKKKERHLVENLARVGAMQALRGLGTLTAWARPLPDFLLIGGKRCGSTSFFHTLGQHPNVLPLFPDKRFLPMQENLKGVRYFDSNADRSAAWYRSHFPTSLTRSLRRRRRNGPVISGEGSPYYLFEPNAPRRAAKLVGAARVVVVLRDPVERAWSHFRDERRCGREPLDDFVVALDRETGRLSADKNDEAGHPPLAFRREHFGYRWQGEYATALERWFEYFDRTQVLVLFDTDLYGDPEPHWRRATEHLEIPAWKNAPTARHMNQASAVDMPAEARSELALHYREFDRELSDLLERPLPWAQRA